jgi:uncharacterized protein YuzE
MKITYDKTIDAMYIKLNEKLAYKSSKKISEDVLVDYSEDGKIIGVEVLAASENTVMPSIKSGIPIEFSPAAS